MNGNQWKSLYSEHPEDYERIVQHEDYEGNLLSALSRIYPFDNADVVEFGAGTGRITVQLASRVKRICAFDLAPPMLRIASRKLRQPGWSSCRTLRAFPQGKPSPLIPRAMWRGFERTGRTQRPAVPVRLRLQQ